MHKEYAGRWYESIAFVQKTTMVRESGQRDTSTWYETLKGPNLLRIDLGNPAAGRGLIFTAESTFVFKDGTQARAVARGNAFLPLVMGVYLEPVDAAARRLALHGFDLTQFHLGSWEGRPTYLVGATAGDSTKPQFWVDAARLVVVRMRVAGKPEGDLLDIRLDDYVPVHGGWLATRVTISRDGKPVQIEEYTEWSDEIALADSLFDRKRWVTGGHWAGAPRAAGLWQHR
jgi:hypothetical protein